MIGNLDMQWTSPNATPCSNFSENNFAYGDTNNRSFWMKDLSSTSPIYSLETGSQEHRDRYNAAPMGQGVRLCVSFIQPGQPYFEECPARVGRSFNGSDVKMANPALLFSAFNDIYTETITASANKKSVGKPTRPTAPFSREKVITVGGMEDFRKGLEMEGVSVNAAKLSLTQGGRV